MEEQKKRRFWSVMVSSDWLHWPWGAAGSESRQPKRKGQGQWKSHPSLGEMGLDHHSELVAELSGTRCDLGSREGKKSHLSCSSFRNPSPVHTKHPL